MIVKILKLIPVKLLAKYLPEILAYVLTKALTWLLIKYPKKSEKVVETAQEIMVAMGNAVAAADDGIITKEEIQKQKKLWKEVFNF